MRFSFSLIFLLFFSPVVEANGLGDLIEPYGSLRPEVIGRFPESGDHTRRMDNGYSRIGVKGQATLSEALTGFYKYERRVSANDGEDDGAVRRDNNELRQVHVGIRGNLGSLSVGRHYGLYYDYIDDELDRHRSHYSDAIVFGDLFVSNSLLYQSPEFGNVHFGALIELNDADNQGQSIDERVEIAATFQSGRFSLHGGYVDSPVHSGLFGVASSFRYRSLNLVGVYQKLETSNRGENTLFSLAVDVDLTPLNRVRLALTTKQNALDEVYAIVGGDHRFSDHFLAFAEFFRKSTDVAQPGDESAFITGFRFDF